MLAPGRAREHHVGQSRRLSHEDVLADEQLEVLQRLLHIGGVGLSLQRILAEVVEGLDLTLFHAMGQVGQLEAGLGGKLPLRQTPCLFELGAGLGVLHLLIAGKQARPHAHVAGALDVVLAAHRSQAGVVAADLVRDAGNGGDGVHRLHALALLGDAHAPADNGVGGRSVHAGGLANIVGAAAADVGDRLRRVVLDGLPPLVEAVGVGVDEGAVVQVLAHDNVGERIHEGEVAAVLDLDVQISDARRLNGARVDDDDLGALLLGLHDTAGDDRVRGRGVVAEQHDEVGVLHVGNGDGHGAGAHGVHKADDRGAVAGAGAVVDVVGAHAGAGELLHDVVGLVARPARGAREHNGVGAVLLLDGHELFGREVQRLVPGDALQLAALLAADHRMQDARRENLGVVDEIEARQALQAQLALVGHAIEALGADDHAVVHDEIELATGTAVRADGHVLFHSAIPPWG